MPFCSSYINFIIHSNTQWAQIQILYLEISKMKIKMNEGKIIKVIIFIFTLFVRYSDGKH